MSWNFFFPLYVPFCFRDYKGLFQCSPLEFFWPGQSEISVTSGKGKILCTVWTQPVIWTTEETGVDGGLLIYIHRLLAFTGQKKIFLWTEPVVNTCINTVLMPECMRSYKRCLEPVRVYENALLNYIQSEKRDALLWIFGLYVNEDWKYILLCDPNSLLCLLLLYYWVTWLISFVLFIFSFVFTINGKMLISPSFVSFF